ncbi:aspartate aminotransferase, cytoplasmic-like isoform X2 [Panonychus citri]|uniref:aspartate aminotransferase, cytoplasmic-like isoform X2 n=1 Tax=Panonychus citri TaxID=50023 RepID=UPI002307A13B|nr:aspartate aminotransferase, cytoplasmic-like isoform X2 [Panonychus citri]
MSIFNGVETARVVETFHLSRLCDADPFPEKINLTTGAYRGEDGKPWVLPVVRKVEQEMAADETLTHEYLDMLGDPDYSIAATKMLLGKESIALKEGRAFGIQALSGTGSLRIGADFLRSCLGADSVYISAPSWPNHQLLFNHSGYKNIKTYRYWDATNLCLDFNGMIEDLSQAPAGSVIILHVCAHNPTGCDPTAEQWEKIANLMREKKLFPFFDCAYQGFASGDLEKDAFAVRYFVDQGFELFCAQSFAKNFGLYNERTGNLTIVVKDPKVIVNIKAQITLIVRGNYSNPPAHGVRVVKRVLSDPKLFGEWEQQIKIMANRIIETRKSLREKLEALGTSGKWNHITDQIGMFSYLGLSENQVNYLVDQCHIYLPKSARISMAGINKSNIDYLAKSIHDAVTQ